MVIGSSNHLQGITPFAVQHANCVHPVTMACSRCYAAVYPLSGHASPWGSHSGAAIPASYSCQAFFATSAAAAATAADQHGVAS